MDAGAKGVIFEDKKDMYTHISTMCIYIYIYRERDTLLHIYIYIVYTYEGHRRGGQEGSDPGREKPHILYYSIL